MAKRKAAKKKTKRKVKRKTKKKATRKTKKKASRYPPKRTKGKIKAYLWHRHGGHAIGFGETYMDAHDSAEREFLDKYGEQETPVGESYEPPLPRPRYDPLPHMD